MEEDQSAHVTGSQLPAFRLVSALMIAERCEARAFNDDVFTIMADNEESRSKQ